MRDRVESLFTQRQWIIILSIVSFFLSVISSFVYFIKGDILAYGDAESHINIAKRVIDSLTPGLAQLGGIWLPLPHLLMLPFVYFNSLWQTGFAGSIVGGICYIVAAVFIFKLSYLLFKDTPAAIISFLIFALNPNILYLQATPMSELPLIVFFVLSVYYFITFVQDDKNIFSLILAAFFGFCASLSRYDGWFLVGFELISLFIYYLPKRSWKIIEGKSILFSTLAFFGISLWFLWDFIILGNPLYFSSSPFSANSQQQGWLAKGELPAHQNVLLSFLYYFITSMHNIGLLIFIPAILGFVIFIFSNKIKNKLIISLLLFFPFIFYWVTLYLGQAVIFIPDLTPSTYQWRLFNVRYGVMMIPFAAFFFGYLFSKRIQLLQFLLIVFLLLQSGLFLTGKDATITLQDGTIGLSAAKKVDATSWMQQHYDKGLVLLDDYARTLSVIKSGIPLNKVIYIGNKPYWEESLRKPEKYATWVVLQKDDEVWKSLYQDPAGRGVLFKYFQKVYTSPEILIFKRNPAVVAST